MKDTLRKSFSQIRDELDCKSRENFQKKIESYFFESEYFKRGSFFVYNSFKSEVDTSVIIDSLKKHNKTVYLPKISGGRMLLVEYLGQAFTKSGYGILEPDGTGFDIDVDICLVPLLAFDKSGGRLGYGKGYYDKYLFDKECKKIGLVFSFQMSDEYLPQLCTDIKLDAVITDKGILHFK